MAGKADSNYVVDRYLSTKNDLCSSTYANYRYVYDLFCKDGFGKRKVTDIRYSDVLQFYLGQMEKGIKVKSLQTLQCVIHPALDMAVRDDIIRKNPSDKVMSEVKKSLGRKQKVERALTLEQQTELINYVTGHPLYDIWRPLFTVLLGTGCRIGKFCGLTLKDIDLVHGLSILTKTNAGTRKLPMTEDVFRCFQLFIED